MCDTMVALGPATAAGVTLFAKNSDRQPNEAQAVIVLPARTHPSGATLRCTHVSVPQVARTHAVLLSKPFWIWGAEMGVNEHGVAIGNEAVFTKRIQKRGAALLGMDLVRLGLERSKSADEALSVITGLLEAHGQGGEAGYDAAFRYDNSFILADRASAWVLETSGRTWVAERVRERRSISNGLTIRGAGDERGGVPDDVSFARQERDPLISWFAGGAGRCARSGAYLRSMRGVLRPEMLMAFLRSHAVAPDRFEPADGFATADVCMHASWGPVRISQTTGSLVVSLGETTRAWVTGTSTPCTGIFKPIALDAPPPPGLAPTGDRDLETLFWRHEAFARDVQRDHAARVRLFARERDELERSLLDESPEVAFERADAALLRWHTAVRSSPSPRRGRLFDRAWRRYDARAGARREPWIE